ncbi:precorrin-6Y C5,15-methyltransferase (decarboxylating) subunit CbiT [Oribacterium sp. WCC10]|uniref:precorrin-6Y C5,15-methyltransferase (decarboxylating) subunit CbiT n=1 Tax=Oribacterium sp. WCC10 TaxID=1855343 RepID=UPI0008E0C7FE|nr:precorrin-6Y C5,15-methyltransferase (decarboxylating) subunit CbiT [Oribacterium sp. WCC10]SFG74157.1 precorrin-6Y C5,15-methyltransferase (decarboxylating) [Oribacterium sp. WCC10]
MRIINLIGVGPGSPEMMTTQAIDAIKNSDVLMGAARALKTAQDAAPELDIEICEVVKTEDMVAYIKEHPEKKVISAVFTGDTSVYSGAIPLKKALARNMRVEGNEDSEDEDRAENFEIRNFAGVSSIQYFLSKRSISMADVKLVSLHGRHKDMIPLIRENKFVCALLGSEDTVSNISEELIQFGLSSVKIIVGERLSYEDEKFTVGKTREMRGRMFDRLAIALFENDDAVTPIRSYGIGDEHFERTGGVPITKRDVRALSLCRLAIREDSIIYDIGAGSGSMSIEAGLACPEGKVISVEVNQDAIDTIERNRYQFKVDNIRIVRGKAPECFEEMEMQKPGERKNVADEGLLPIPDRVFIGGSKGNLQKIVDWAVGVNPDVVIVINTVTLESVAEVLEIERKLTDYNFEMVEIQATGLERRGSYHMHRAENPITITRISRR